MDQVSRERYLSAFKVIEDALKQYAEDASIQEFKTYAWEYIDANVMIERLLSSEQFFGQHQILMSGLWTWVASLGDEKTTRHAIVLAAGKMVIAAESIYTDQLAGKAALAEALFRFEPAGYVFFNQVYRPIGGLASIIKAKAPAHLRRSLGKSRQDIDRAIAMMKLMHFAVDHLDKKRYRSPSVNSSKKFFERVKSGSSIINQKIDDRVMGYSVSATKKYLGLLYAADSVQIKAEESLLDCARRGKISRVRDLKFLPEWLGKARYAVDHILGNSFKPAWLPVANVDLSKHASVVIPDPHLTAEDIALWKKILQK